MTARFRELPNRFKEACKKLVGFLKRRWKRVSESERKTITRALLMLAAVAVIGLLLLVTLRHRPRRNVQVDVVCSTIKLSVPFHAKVQYGTGELTLFNFTGTAKGCDRDSIQPKPSPRPPRRSIDLDLVASGTDSSWLNIKPHVPASTQVDVYTPADTSIVLGDSPSVAEQMLAQLDLTLDPATDGETKVRWQVDQPMSLQAQGLDIKPLVFPVEEETKIEVAPIFPVAVDFDLHAHSPAAQIKIRLKRDPNVLGFEPIDPKQQPYNFEVQGCTSGSVTLGETPVELKADTPAQVKFEDSLLQEIGLRLGADKAGLAIKASGRSREMMMAGVNRNPTLSDEIGSTTVGGQRLFAIILIGIICLILFLLGKIGDVLVGVFFGNSKHSENATEERGGK